MRELLGRWADDYDDQELAAVLLAAGLIPLR